MDFTNTGSKWIWNGNTGVNQYVCFRKEFDLDDTDAKILVSCDTNYSMWINGEFAATGQYLAYPEDKYYDTIDISTYAKSGKNTLCILVYYQGIGSFSYSKGEPGLIYAIQTSGGYITDDDTYTKCASGFLQGDIHIITSQLGPSFLYDANKNENWTEADYRTDSTWVATSSASWHRPMHFLQI